MINERPELRFPTIGIFVVAAALLAGGCGGGGAQSGKDGPSDKAPLDQALPEVASPDSDQADAPGDGGAPADGASDDAAADAGDDATDAADVAVTDGGGDATDVAAADAGGNATDAADDAGGDATDAADVAADAAPGDAAAADGDGSDLPPIHGPLLAHWPFDEGTGTTTADTSLNGDPGTLANGATWTTSGFPAAMFANPAAVVLDGVDDFVEVGVRAIPRNEAPKTVSLWFWLAAPVTTPGRQNFIALSDFAGSGFGTQIGLDAGRASVWFMGEAAGLFTATTTATAGWHHVAYTYDGSVHRLYLDAQLLGEVTRASPAAPVSSARFGGFDVAGLEMFGGRIDDARIYDSALNLTAITVLNGGGSP
jgi:hypothetical protein